MTRDKTSMLLKRVKHYPVGTVVRHGTERSSRGYIWIWNEYGLYIGVIYPKNLMQLGYD